MTELQTLYQRKGEVIHEMRDIYTQAEKRGEGLNVDEEAKWANLETEFKTVQSRIEKGEEVRKLLNSYETEMDSVTASTQETRAAFTEKTVTNTAKDKPEITYRSAYDKWVAWGPTALNNEERSVLSKGGVVGTRMSTNPEVRGTDPQVSSSAAPGGYLSPETWASNVVESMKMYGGMLQAGYVYTTKGGDVHHIPTEDTTSQVGSIIGQSVADDFSDIAWGEKLMGAFTYTSGIVLISNELLEDEVYNVSGRVQSICAKRVGRILNTHLTTGAGTTLPFGVVTEATDSGISAGSATAVTRTELLDLIHSVDPSYRVGPKVGFMFNDATLAAIRKLSIGSADDRPLWVPSMREGAPDTIEGHRYYINQDMATMATNAKSILFGDFDAYWIRQVRGMTLSRSSERYFERRSVGYFLTARFDGKLTDTAAIKYFQNA